MQKEELGGEMKAKRQSVDEFVADLAHPQAELIDAIRAQIKSASPTLVEGIKWNAPSYALRGNDIITFNLRNYGCVALIFHTGPKGKDTHTHTTLFTDESGLLEWVADKRAVLRIRDNETLERHSATIAQLIRTWVAHADNGFKP